jgi:hypothetical protein
MKPADFLRGLGAGPVIPLISGGETIFVPSSEILILDRGADDSASALLQDGSTLQTEGRFTVLETSLKNTGSWFRISRDSLANGSRIRKILPQDQNDNLILFDTDASRPLSPAYRDEAGDFLGMSSLSHVTPFSRPGYWMMKMGVREIVCDILYMTREQLVEEFGDSNGRVVISDLLVNFLWQLVRRIRKGEPSPVEGGNVRSLWYMIKPTLNRVGALDGTNHYKTLSEKLGEMVSRKILSYSEFQLYEFQRWTVGMYNPHEILVAEKEAHYRFLQQMQDLAGMTIIATGGQPSTMTSEYFSTALKQAVPDYHKPDAMVVIALVDYDPHGWLLLDTFMDDLRTFGIKNPELINLSVPDNYEPRELEFQHYDLLREDEVPGKILRSWMKRTGGIEGNPWGMEVDVLMMNRLRVRQLFLKAAEPWMKVPAPVPVGYWENLFRATRFKVPGSMWP